MGFYWQGLSDVEDGGAKMNGGYIPLCPEVYKGDKGLTGVRPLPCVRDEHGETREQPVYRLLGKVDEELGEAKAEILNRMPSATTVAYAFTQYKKDARRDAQMRVAEEIADTITALTTLSDALGIDAEMRDEAQRRVNSKNRERGRL